MYTTKNRDTIPSMKFGTGSRSALGVTKEVQGKPGPGQHSPEPQKVQTAAPRYRFGTGKRGSESMSTLKTPGPGDYMAKTFTGFDLPRYSMGKTIEWEPRRKEQKHKPGPGAYSPSNDPTKKKEAAWKIGSEVRRDLKFEK